MFWCICANTASSNNQSTPVVLPLSQQARLANVSPNVWVPTLDRRCWPVGIRSTPINSGQMVPQFPDDPCLKPNSSNPLP